VNSDRLAFFDSSVRAVRAALAPMLLIQAAAALLVFAYFRSDGVRAWADGVGALKLASGLSGAFVAGFLAGGLLPEIAKAVTGRLRSFSRAELVRATWTGVVYGLVAICVDLLYVGQAVWFGHGRDAATLTMKTAVDMLIFSPFVSIPLATYLLGWWQSGFRARFWRRAFTFRFYREEVLGAMPLCWAYWVPILLLTYALPLPIQFPFAILAESAWSIVFVFFVVDRGGAPEVAVP